MGYYLNGGPEFDFVINIVFWAKQSSPRKLLGQKSGTDAENHEESDNSTEIVQKSENIGNSKH